MPETPSKTSNSQQLPAPRPEERALQTSVPAWLVPLKTLHTHSMARWIAFGGAAIAGALVLGWWLLPPSVEVVHPVRGPAMQAVYATGTVEPTVMMPIASRVSARLAELNADEGAEVKKGQQLARLEDQDVQNTLKQLQAQQQFARQEYERAAALVKSGAVARATFQRAKADYDSARAASAKAEAEADFLTLIAPDDGKIIRRDGEIGQLIPANQPIFWLSQHQQLRISSEVDEEDISRVKVGQDVLIRADAFPGKIFRGRVQAITPKGDPIARSYRVRVQLAEETPLLIGMTAETNIVLSENKSALLLPASAVQQGGVWLVKDGKLARQSVVTGAMGTKQVEILSGVGPDDQVVVQPHAWLQAGKAVRPSLNDAR